MKDQERPHFPHDNLLTIPPQIKAFIACLLLKAPKDYPHPLLVTHHRAHSPILIKRKIPLILGMFESGSRVD